MQFEPEALSANRSAFGGGATTSILHPIVLIAMIAAIILILTQPKKKIVAPFLLLTFLGSFGEQIYIFGVHWFVLRIIIVAGLIRVFSTREKGNRSLMAGGWTAVDTAYTGWVICHSCAAILQFGGASGVIIYQAGFIWEALGGYILLRCLIRDEDDIAFTLKVFAVVAVCLGVAMLNEKLRSQNIFGYLGAEKVLPEMRDGAIRATGDFAHPILAGVFGATLVAPFWWLWQSGRAKVAGILGFAGSTLMVVTSASSTPLLAYVAAFLGLLLWPMRKNMRALRWGLAILLITLHLVMKAPVWFLIAHVDLVAGNSGYHRAMLIDQCIRHFRQWCLIGTDPGKWGWDMWDMSNQFVAEADTGGLATLVFFVLVIKRGYSRIGTARKRVEGQLKKEMFMWLLGVALLTHVVSFFGVQYFDHTKIAWCAFLAMIIAATASILAPRTEKTKVRVEEHCLILPDGALAHSRLQRHSQAVCFGGSDADAAS
ncbi:MAG: hypothetical protein WBQ85_14255 [Candidatus Sulfotelmatobacter sp.]